MTQHETAALTPGATTFLVGISYGFKTPAHWQVWHESYEVIIDTLRERQAGTKPTESRYFVMEIVVRDTTVIASEVTVV